MTSAAQDVVNRMYEALNAHDPEALGKFYSEDCEVVAPPGEMSGRDAVTQLAGTYWHAFSDLTWTIVNQYADGDTIITEEIVEGVNDGTFDTPDGSVQPTGRRIPLRVCEVSRVQNDEIVSLHLYWDNHAFLRELGVLAR